MNPTSEQVSILDLVTNSSANLSIRALAGTGKTTTLEMIETEIAPEPILCLAFNKSIAKEMTDRFSGTSVVRTFNGLGHRIWASAVGKVAVDPKKSYPLFKEAAEALDKSDRPEIWDNHHEIIQAVSAAKNIGYAPGKHASKGLVTREAFHAALDEMPSPLVADVIDSILLRSIKASYQGLIDFNDQIYMPALFGGSFPRFPLVLVDEAQDLSPANHAMLAKLIRNNRLIIVGDPWQSIYGFRGAKQGGMGHLENKYSMAHCDLSVSFRCPKQIVLATHWRVPHFKWIKEGGHVSDLPSLSIADLEDQSTIICRNNAPLFSVAMRLLSSGRSVSVAGSEIGPKIVGIMKKLGDPLDHRDSILYAIDEWESRKLEKGSKTASDVADCMRVFANFGETLGQAMAYAEHLFKQDGTIRLTTGHKAKGLEWDTVYLLDPWLLSDHEQDLNLRYVMQTRAKERLFTVNSKDIQ